MQEHINKKPETSLKKTDRAPVKGNRTGMPDYIKNGMESLSGYSMDNVRVHYNSDRPSRFQALAYTQGTDIHIAPGQEKHLPHEAWHVVQQMQGRVRPTSGMNGQNINDDTALEHEADVMGRKLEGVVQRMKIPYGEIKDKRIEEQYTNTGVQGGMEIPQYAGRPGTFHHIYPKSRLVWPLRRIEQVYRFFSDPKHNGAKSHEVAELRRLRNVVIQGQSAHDYYWNAGTGFGGVCPEFRTDDPGDEPERVKPRGMPDYFERAKTTRPNNFEKLASDIEKDKLETKAIQDCITIERELREHAVYCTVPNDWNVKKGRKYGEQRRIYSVKG